MNNDTKNTTTDNSLSWPERIKRKVYKPRTSALHDRSSKKDDKKPVCTSDHRVHGHSFEDESAREDSPSRRDIKKEVNSKDWYQINPDSCKYVLCDIKKDMNEIYDLIVRDRSIKEPSIIMSVYGGAKYFRLTNRLEKEFIHGIIHTATIAKAWILTAGINTGVSKLVGESISRARALNKDLQVTCIGLTMWGSIGEQARLKLKSNCSTTPPTLSNTIEDNKDMLEKNHTHCILFDNGQSNGYLEDSKRSDFVKVACGKKKCKCSRL